MSKTTVIEMNQDFAQDKAGLKTKIFICCVALVGIGVINSLWTHLNYQEWYHGLSKPIFSPSPRWIVGLLWTIMYITVGIAVGMIWQIAAKSPDEKTKRRAQIGMFIFLIQVLVNMTVPFFFFDLNNLNMVLTGVSINLILAVAMAVSFYPVQRKSSYILIPYLIWLIYATILDAALVVLN